MWFVLACPKDTYQNGTYLCKRCPDNAVTSGTASVFADCTCAPGFVSSSGGQACSGNTLPAFKSQTKLIFQTCICESTGNL